MIRNGVRNDNNVARVKLKRIETSICSIINIKLSTPIFGLLWLHSFASFKRKKTLKIACVAGPKEYFVN